MVPKNVLVIYKKSMYQIYFMERRRQLSQDENRFSESDVQRLKEAHESHVRTLELVWGRLKQRKVRRRLIYRARKLDYAPFDFVIAVGGDGTVIEAARRVTTQPLLGVNSDPERSFGFFCACQGDGFAAVLDDVLAGKAKTRKLNRMQLTLNGEAFELAALNDILVAHRWPAAMSRYRLQIDDDEEAQDGSGLWFSTAAGASSAIRSAGGKAMRLGSKRLQYQPRELLRDGEGRYRLRGGFVRGDQRLVVESRMREGAIFVDGPHLRLPFPFGARLEVGNAPHPLELLTGVES